MGRMLELIREGKAPMSIVRRAALGELALPTAEAIEILALLAADRDLSPQHANSWRAGDPDVGAEAEQTLQGWPEAELIEMACATETPRAVLRCLLRTQANRPSVIAVLCGNPALSLDELEEAASHGGAAIAEGMLRCERVRNSPGLLALVEQNSARDTARTQPGPEPIAVAANGAAGEPEEHLPSHGDAPEFRARGPHHDQAAELADEDDRPFELVTDAESEADPMAELLKRVKSGETMSGEKVAAPEQKEQLSLLQRIAHMRVGERIKLAMRGGREERMVLIRDRSKLVSLAVLTSPKVDATEMECFAAMKNVQEAVLRAIASNRKNLKNYGVIRALVSNPKTPLDVSLPLLAHLLIKDLRSLAFNKNVNDTIRKRAAGMYRVKTEHKKD